jgi:tetratricopeptide (TPR) repeat protein
MLAVNLGKMLEESGRTPEAIQAYRRAFDADPLILDTPYFAATDVRRRAVEGFRPALPLNTSDRLVAEARQALQASDGESALCLLTEAAQANVRNARAFAWRAWVQADLGQVQAAWRDIQTAVLVDPTATEALALSALVAQRLGRNSEALDFARRTVSSLENASESTGYYAELYRRPYLPFDLAPQLIRALPTEEVLQALELAAASFEQDGQAEQARAARAWMVVE